MSLLSVFNLIHRKSIFEKWKAESAKESTAALNSTTAKMSELDLSAQLASITEGHSAAYQAARAAGASAHPAPDKSVKEAIMAQYAGGIEDSEEEEDEPSVEGAVGGGAGGKDP